MAYVWQRWIAREFRAAGLTVIEIDGWENRGRPASTGAYDPWGPVTQHHTGATSGPSDPGPTLRTLIVGRSDLPGPLAPWSVRFDGVVVVIAAGRCNHAGRVGKSGAYGMPLGADGNAIAMGDEVDTDGRQTMPEAQRRAIAITNAVALRYFGRPDPDLVHRHADISGTGKWDLGSRSTAGLQDDTAAELAAMEEDEAMSPEDKTWIADQIRESMARVPTRDDLSRALDGLVTERMLRQAIRKEIGNARISDPSGEHKPNSLARLLWQAATKRETEA